MQIELFDCSLQRLIDRGTDDKLGSGLREEGAKTVARGQANICV